jgi:glycerol-3-phosphate acyltransferase PlsX
VLLVGDKDAVEGELSLYGEEAQRIRVIPSEGKITDDEHPVRALRHKPKASIMVATQLLKNGQADALVSMGSTGATMASAALLLGTLEGLERPCLGGPFHGLAPRTVVVDMGSNVDCRPSLLLSFAALGVAFSRRLLGITNPRVALLSVGEEAAKGNRQVQESHTLFRESHLNFVGNVEGMDFFTDKADVIVCDGFIGNILIKFAEGLGSALVPYLRRHLSEILPAEQVRQIGEALWTTTNLPRTMGGPLFGVDGLVMIGHGSSTADGVAGAINTGLLCHRLELVEGFRQELVGLHRAAVPEA